MGVKKTAKHFLGTTDAGEVTRIDDDVEKANFHVNPALFVKNSDERRHDNFTARVLIKKFIFLWPAIELPPTGKWR